MKHWPLILASLSLACAPQPDKPSQIRSAKFGIFFGGQIQERREIPRVLEASKQRQGFRLEFSKALSEPLTVSWEIDMPGAGRRVRDLAGRRRRGRITRLGQATVPQGRKRFDQELVFVPEDSAGTWNLRVRAFNQSRRSIVPSLP